MSLPETATLAEFARLSDRKRSYISELKATGRLVMTDDGKRVRVAESLALIEATRDPSKAGVAARHAAARVPAEGAGVGVGAADAVAAPHAATERDDAAFAPAGGSDKAGSAYQAARAVRERYLAMSAKRDYEQAMGKLMPADQVLAVVSAATTALRTRLERLPDVLGPQLAPLEDEGQVRALLAEAIEHALADASRHFASVTNRDPLQ